jgi:hypothetical protein
MVLGMGLEGEGWIYENISESFKYIRYIYNINVVLIW